MKVIIKTSLGNCEYFWFLLFVNKLDWLDNQPPIIRLALELALRSSFKD